MKISACVIMRDAAADIADCLESVRDGVDEIVVVDTGSVDDSVEIARRFTDKVFFFEWKEDFSAARNFCLDRAEGDWIIFLDSDEFLARETRGRVRRMVARMDAQGFDKAMVRRENVDDCNLPLDMDGDFSLRIFRNEKERRYRDPIHEYLGYSGTRENRGMVVSPEDLLVLHRGYAPARVQGKFDRNARMLREMQAEGEQKVLLDYYLSGAYFREKEYGKAVQYIKRVIAEEEIPWGDPYSLWRLWIEALRKMGADRPERERVLKFGMEKFPELPDFYAHYGALLLERGDTEAAWENFRKAEALRQEFIARPMADDMSREDRGRLYQGMAEVCLKRGEAEQAGRYAEMEWEVLGSVERKRERKPEFIGWVPPNSRSVVEFGCGEGEAGRAFLRIRPDCCYVGVDRDEEALRVAGRCLSMTAEASPAAFDFGKLPMEAVDCLVYRDSVLRDLTPGCLRRHGEMLSEKGQMIFVLENPGYFRRLTGAFSAQENSFQSGMVLPVLLRRLEDAGLDAFDVQPVYLQEDAEERQRPETGALLRAFGAYLEKEAGSDVWACRFIVRAAKTVPEEKRMLLQALVGEPVVSGRPRVLEPCGFLGTTPGIACQVSQQGFDVRQGQEFGARVFLRQRYIFEDAATGLKQLSMLRQTDHILVYETDDHPWKWKEAYERSWYLDFIAAHAVQVATPELAEVVRRYNPHVKVLRNELAELPPRRIYDESEPVTIFFGAVNREQEWQDILPAINDIARKYSGKVQFKVLSDRPFFEALRTRHKEFIGNPAYFSGKLVPHEIYRKELGTADIVLLPLRDTAFNRVKSDILFLEAAAHGAVVLASPTVYGRTVKDGRTGFLYRNDREFHHRLQQLVKERPRRRKMAENAYDYVRRERMLSQHYEERLAFYEELLAKKEELDRELTLRLARLAKRLAGVAE